MPALAINGLPRDELIFRAVSSSGELAAGDRHYGDIIIFLKDQICYYFREESIGLSLKYIDPSYLIRSVPANTADRLVSDQMARYVAQAAMAGNTEVLIGMVNNMFLHVPICTAIAEKERMEVTGDLWTNVLLSTGQPPGSPRNRNSQ